MTETIGEWKLIRLGDVLSVKHGFAFRGEFFSDSGEYVVVTPGNFHESGGFKPKSGKEKFYLGDFPENYLLSKDDLIIAMTEQATGLLGSAALVPKSSIYLHNQRIGKIVITDSLLMDKYFLYCLFNTDLVRSKIQASATGTKVRHTAPERVEEINVSVPPLSLQRKSGSILKSFDNFIQNNERRIEILEESAKALYREWFVHYRYPGHENDTMVDSELGPIPKQWEIKMLKEITEQLPVRKRYSQKLAEDNGIIPIIDQSKDGILGFHCNEDGIEASLLNPVFTFANHTCAMRILHSPFSVIQNVFPKIGLSGVANTYFAYHSGLSKQTIEDYKGHHPLWRDTKVPVPSLRIQELFAQRVSESYQMQFVLNQLNVRLSNARNLLLPRLISGEIDVSDLDLVA